MRFFATNKGLRSRNEDSAFVGHDRLAVADGMGGHHNGHLASQALIRLVSGTASRFDFQKFAEYTVFANAGEDAGSTISAAFIHGGYATIVHAGDSAIFAWKRVGGVLTRLTPEQNVWGESAAGGHVVSRRCKRLLTGVVQGGKQNPQWFSTVVPVQDITLIGATDGWIGAFEDERGYFDFAKAREELRNIASDTNPERAAERSCALAGSITEDNATLAFWSPA